MKSDIIINELNDYYVWLNSINYAKREHINNKLNENKEYANLEKKLSELNFKLGIALASEDETTAAKLKITLENLKEKKRKFLELNLNYIKNSILNYECEECKDTGRINGKYCKCYYKNLTKIALKKLGVQQPEFNLKDFKKPQELKKHYALADDFILNFPATKCNNYVFIGKVGTGKTYLAKYISSKLSEIYTKVVLTATQLNNIFLSCRLGETDYNLTFEILSTCDFLVIDDLGTEPMLNNVTADYLLALLSTRLDLNKHFIITTNLTTDKILERYGERLLSRLSDKTKTKFIPFNNSDFRRKGI